MWTLCEGMCRACSQCAELNKVLCFYFSVTYVLGVTPTVGVTFLTLSKHFVGGYVQE